MQPKATPTVSLAEQYGPASARISVLEPNVRNIQKQSKSTSSWESLESRRKPKAIFTKETTNIQTESLQTCLDSSTFHCCRVLRFGDDKNIQKFSETNHLSVVLVSLLRTYQRPKLGSTWPYGQQHSTIWRPCYVLQLANNKRFRDLRNKKNSESFEPWGSFPCHES